MNTTEDAETGGQASVQHEPWVEKYRPTSISNIRGQEKIVTLFENTVKRNQVMHFMFHGSPGTGKTSMILSFCRDIYDEQRWASHVLEINASYDRGIDMVEKIKTFCKKSITPFVRKGRSIYYKFVILDEADTLTNDAQNSLRRCIEIYSYNTRFCFLCNYPSKIITPILSRCCVCHFQPIPQQDAKAQMRHICTQEGLECDDRTLQSIYEHSRGDLRTCVSSLQALYYMYGHADEGSFSDYIRNFKQDIWKKLRVASVDEIPGIADAIHLNAYSARIVIVSFIEWVLDNCGQSTCDRIQNAIYDLSLTLSKMERQKQYCIDSRLLIVSVVHSAWMFMREYMPTETSPSVSSIA